MDSVLVTRGKWIPTCTPYRTLCMNILCKFDLKNDIIIKVTVKMLSRECSTSRNHNTKLRHNLSEIRITNDTSTEFCICKTTATNTQQPSWIWNIVTFIIKIKFLGWKIVVPRLMVGKEYTCKQYNHKWLELFNSILLFIQN